MKNQKPSRKTKDAKPGSLHPAGSAATCDFLTGLTGLEKCQKPATHQRVPGTLCYCAEHAARLLPYCSMMKLPPNAGADLQPRRKE